MAKILVVDDDPDMVLIATTNLLQAGHQVASAHNRTDGMKAVDGEKPDLIVLDVMMEQEDDGIVMAQDLRRKGVKTPIIMLTNVSKISGMKFDKDDEMVPVNEFLEKPVEAEKLIKLIDKLLA